MVEIRTTFLAAGGNGHPASSDWDSVSGWLAFGAARNIALWNPSDEASTGIEALLIGHKDTVTAVKFLLHPDAEKSCLISGSADHTIRLWKPTSELSSTGTYESSAVLDQHTGSITAFATSHKLSCFASASADRTLKIWRLSVLDETKVDAELLQTISISQFIPLAIAVSPIQDSGDSLILAVAGTKNVIQIFTAESPSTQCNFQSSCTLTGHEGWIRSVSFAREKTAGSSDLLLATASQDKYTRLWRVHKGQDVPAMPSGAGKPISSILDRTLSNKAHAFSIDGSRYTITFEALLLGHEDWIYQISWSTSDDRLRLLSASADNSLGIWESDTGSGIWTCITRLGEISGQKGSTTATGSTGGFWTGLWSPDSSAVVSLGRTGNWRLWSRESDQDRWEQLPAVGGHFKDVMGIAWARDGAYLLSTSSDQTTRLFAEWKRGPLRSWHEFARPQIHGYDLNCIDVLDQSRFISGADEKLLRVFDEPKVVATLLQELCGISVDDRDMPEAANMPVLGLSNKIVDDEEEGQDPAEKPGETAGISPPSSGGPNSMHTRPPLEDFLARQTLWPESEKLYGHGYEISAVAASHDGSLVATACRASSIDHATIRVYETKDWREIKPPLKAHSLTVTRLRFSDDDRYLLSVGRDRQWAVFERDVKEHATFTMALSNPKGHSRMILDAAWAPSGNSRVFATAGRDKLTKLWRMTESPEKGAELAANVTYTQPVTAIDFLQALPGNLLYLATGLEDGSLQLLRYNGNDLSLLDRTDFNPQHSPSQAITQLSWRPIASRPVENGAHEGTDERDFSRELQLGVGSSDNSLRIYSIC